MRWLGVPKHDIQTLVQAHFQALYRYAYRLSGSGPDAEDLTQETFCQAQLKIHQLREADKAKSWLFTILRNAYLHKVRSSKLGKQVSLDSVDELPERSAEPMPIVDSAELQKALDELPELFRTPLILYYFEEFSYRDIAEQMDVPLGTVMSRLARAKAYLRERLADPADLIEKGSREEGNHGMS
jgi:RNA polymerase sigma-70 factor, ECF subfamily